MQNPSLDSKHTNWGEIISGSVPRMAGSSQAGNNIFGMISRPDLRIEPKLESEIPLTQTYL